ncbi:hypothetical protein Hoch_3471 [Haliangium ochraceum DSM 14365]|uniref:Uncharacterized protein n=1 Tax=Haliangium ochraceum (strain DSM 14365 / JCM 11303 / SMP-2) TaxID=502025 RepID=D0LW41_HALO1|nr:hypothetical protein Hoch_3471 [Haliangium ochraceum DSM 14365]
MVRLAKPLRSPVAVGSPARVVGVGMRSLVSERPCVSAPQGGARS